jgi:potassium-transporting ATPase potassium-binding subunit
LQGTDWVQILIYAAILAVFTPIIGGYIFNVYSGTSSFAISLLGWLEKLSYRVSGINPKEEMTWTHYAKTLAVFNIVGFVILFLLQITQGFLPLNPQSLPAISLDLAYNTTASFVTNTNWQAYAGEVTLSYLTQMLGLAVQNFMSAATGMAVLLALIRGLTRKNSDTIGNFWTDMVRTVVYLLLPLSILLAVLLVIEGSVQTFSPYVEISTLENGKQTIPLGPVASQVAIKQLGTNGGGFFNANSTHPLENPTPLSNLLEMLAILLIPAASVYAYGMMIGSKKHGLLLLLAMSLLWASGMAVSLYSEYLKNPVLEAYPVLEGKETRFGIVNSLLWSVSTTGASNGSVNVMIDSLSPLSGGIAMLNIMVGEVIFGGVGVGLCGMIMFVLLTVFLCGLMVGRTPEYLGKKIDKHEMKWVMLAILTPPSLILLGAGISSVFPQALSSLANQGPHGLSEILYAFSSSAGNNGSAFAGLNANTVFYNLVLGTTMLVSRVTILTSSLAIAGLLAKKKITPPSLGTFSTNSKLFFVLLISVIVIEGALAFFPAFALGPFIEHLLMLEGQSF